MAEAKKKSTRAKKTSTKKVEEPAVIEAEKVAAPTKEQITAQPINMVVEEKAPPVKILYLDACIPNNQIPIGNNRYITGSGRVFPVPLEQFEGEFMSPLVMKLIDQRKFIVLDGLTDEQRHQYNCYYEDGEIVKSEGMFDDFFDMPTEQVVEIFQHLCAEHKRLVATRFITAYYEKHDNRVTRDKVEALNAASKTTDPDGLFTPIVKDINDNI